MSRTATLVFAVLAVIFGLAALYALTTGGGADGAAPTLLGVEPSQVRALRVERAGGETVAVERLPDGTWRLRRGGEDDSAAWPVNPGNARGAVRVLSDLRPLNTVPATTPINEVVTISAILEDGSTRSLHVDAESLGGRRLVRTGDGRAAMVDAAVVDAFTSPGPLGWRQALALPGVGAEVSRITLAGPGGTIRLARSGASWRLDAPVRMRAGEAQVRQLISSLAGASVRRFIDDPAASAAAPANAEQARLTIVCETDERALDGDAVRTVTRSRTLHIGAPADVEQTTWFARTGDGQALVVEASIAILSLDPSVYAAATAAATRPEDVGTVIIRPATGAERGFRRGISGWSRMAPDGSLAEVDGAPIEDLLVFLSQRVAPRVRFEAPAGLEPIATITLLDFASGPLETVGVFRTPEGAACELRPIGAESPVYLVYPGADAPGLLIGSP